MNSLGRKINPGEVVVVKKSWMKDEFQKLEKRLFRCSGNGFGTSAKTAGTAIYGEWLADGSKDRIEGHEISKSETIEYQKQQAK